MRSVLFVVAVVYCTLFLAVATPFFPLNFPPVYICGFLLLIMRLLGVISAVYFYVRSKIRSVHFTDTSILYEADGIKKKIFYRTIEEIRVTPLRICIISTDSERFFLPLMLYRRDKYLDFLANFEELMPENASMLRRLRDSGEAFIMATILAVHIIQFLVQNYYIPTESMRMTLIENDNIFAEKISYGVRIPKMAGMSDELVFHPFRHVPARGEVVIFVPPEGEKQTHEYIKRIIAVPGDYISISDGQVVLNGSPLDEPYVIGRTTMNYTGYSVEGRVPEGNVVVMGDNRENSRDSRVFGYLPIKNIRGRALFLYFNWDYIKSFDFSRFGPIH